MTGRVVAVLLRTAAISALVASPLDLVLRQLTRVSLSEWLGLGAAWSPASSVCLAAIGAALLIAGAAPRARHQRTVAVLTVCFTAGIAAQLQLGARLQSDGFYYFAFTRSIWFDHDVDLTNDYRMLGLDDAQHQFLLEPTVTGYAQSAWAIGPALAWSPFFGVGHLAASTLAASGRDVSTDGTSFPYRQAVVLGGLFYGLLGLWWTYRLTRTCLDARAASLATVAVGLGSFVLWYLVREPTMSHGVSMASVAAFLLAWAHLRDRTDWRSLVGLGLIGGVMIIMRWQNAVILILPVLLLLRHPQRLVWLGAGVFLGTLPQMLTWHALYGAWITQPPVSPRMFWWNPQWIDVLWSSRSGLFATSPTLYLAALGLWPLWRRHRALAVAGVLTLVLMTWTNGAVEDWWAGASYGGRRFDSLIPFLVAGLAAAIAAVRPVLSRRPGLVATTLLFSLVVWNVSLLAVARAGTYRLGQIVSFADLGGAQASTLEGWTGHPWSMPANLIFAWRNGVSPDRFDLLQPNRFLGDPARPYGRVDVGLDDELFVSTGWYDAERDGDLTFRWADQEAEVLIPLDHAAPLLLQLQLRAFTYDGAPPQSLTLLVNGRVIGEREIGGDWIRLEVPTESSQWRSGVNRVTLRFRRATSPAEVGGNDRRRLAAAVDYVRIQVTDLDAR